MTLKEQFQASFRNVYSERDFIPLFDAMSLAIANICRTTKNTQDKGLLFCPSEPKGLTLPVATPRTVWLSFPKHIIRVDLGNLEGSSDVKSSFHIFQKADVRSLDIVIGGWPLVVDQFVVDKPVEETTMQVDLVLFTGVLGTRLEARGQNCLNLQSFVQSLPMISGLNP